MNEDEIADRTLALPARFADRLNAEVRQSMDEDAWAGEYGVVIHELVATLAVDQIPITRAEREELAALVDATEEGTEFLPRLSVVEPDAG